MSHKVLVGCDPELFLRNSKGQLISAHDILPGTKAEPYKVSNGAIQVDGVAAEFNTDPTDSATNFLSNIFGVMEELKARAKGATLVIEPFAVFEPSYFSSLPGVVTELGCNPDYNAWTGQVNPSPDASSTMRTASGHLHIGWCKDVNPLDKFHFEDCRTLVKELDYYIGLFSLMWDKDNTRRQLYGKAGAFRPKPYGVEYRVLSNMWLKSPKIQAWLFNAIQHTVEGLFSGKETMEAKYGNFAQTCIDGNDTKWFVSETGQLVHMYSGLNSPDVRDYETKVKKSASRANTDDFDVMMKKYLE